MTQMTFNVNVSVTVDITQRTEQILQRLLTPREPQEQQELLIAEHPITVSSRRPQRTQEPEQTPEPQPQAEAPTDEQNLLFEDSGEIRRAPTFTEPTELENITPPQPVEEPQPQPQQQTEVFNATIMRKIMEDVRVRLLGPSPENKNHPLYKKLNGQFKTEASLVSMGKCDTPTMLPELGIEYCIAFRTACEALQLDSITNDIIPKAPF